MEEIKNMQSVYEEPKLEVIHFSETDIITTSDGLRDSEGEIIPFKNN